jgi:putative acetyltransferase
MIRKFLQSDIDKVIDIWLKASIKAHNFVEREFWESKVKDMREIYIPSGETYVFEEDDIIKGFVSLYKNTIAALFVSPCYQGKGTGSLLMAKAKEIRDDLNLTVYKENQRSVKFYKKCGFKIELEQIDEHTGYPELVMAYHS